MEGPRKAEENEMHLLWHLHKVHTCKWHLSLLSKAEGHIKTQYFHGLLSPTVIIHPSFCTSNPVVFYILWNWTKEHEFTNPPHFRFFPVVLYRVSYHSKEILGFPYLRPGVLDCYWVLTTDESCSGNSHSMWTSISGWDSQDPLWTGPGRDQCLFSVKAWYWRISDLPPLEWNYNISLVRSTEVSYTLVTSPQDCRWLTRRLCWGRLLGEKRKLIQWTHWGVHLPLFWGLRNGTQSEHIPFFKAGLGGGMSLLTCHHQL